MSAVYDNDDGDNHIKTLTVRSPLFLTRHFNIAVSSTTVVTFRALISSK